MSLDFSGLGDLAKQSPSKVKAGWQPPTIDDLADGSVLAFDQSLTATGWVWLTKGVGRVVVLGAGKFGGGHDDLPRGVEQDLRRSVDVFGEVSRLIQDTVIQDAGAHLVHESPPHAGNVKGGGSSSLMTAVAVRCAANLCGVSIEMLGAQPGKKLVCGNANADKPTAHAALKLHCLPWIMGSHLVTNEATRDALIVALLKLSRMKS